MSSHLVKWPSYDRHLQGLINDINGRVFFFIFLNPLSMALIALYHEYPKVQCLNLVWNGDLRFAYPL